MAIALKSLNRLFIILFLSLVTLPFIQLNFKIFPDLSLNEKRKKAKKPNQFFQFHSVKAFKSSLNIFSDYVEDNFGFRNIFIYLNGRIKIYLFKISPNNTVVVGKDGWLFYDRVIDGKIDPKEMYSDFIDTTYLEGFKTYLENKGKENYTEYGIPDYFGLTPLKDSDLEQIKNNLESLHSYFKSKKIKFQIVIAPNKHTIYPEFLPDWINSKERKISRFDQVINYIGKNSPLEIIDYRKMFLDKKKMFQLYRKLDTHLNDQGNLLFADEILANLNHPHIGKINPKEIKIDYNKMELGDLVDFSGLPGVFSDVTPKIEFIQMNSIECPVDNKAQLKESPMFCSMVDNPNLPKLILFGDSFAYNLSEVFREKFSKFILYSYNTQISEDLLINEKPDFVILEIVERSIHHLKKIIIIKH